MIWIVSQILMILFAVFSAWHHSPAVKCFREYVKRPNPYEDPFHFWAWFQAALFTVVVCLGSFHFIGWWTLLQGFLLAAWYWLLFDPVLNKSIGFSWDYLGAESGLDQKLVEMFGRNSGEIKAVAMLLFIIAANLVKILS